MVSRNLERPNENDGFKMTALETHTGTPRITIQSNAILVSKFEPVFIGKQNYSIIAHMFIQRSEFL